MSLRALAAMPAIVAAAALVVGCASTLPAARGAATGSGSGSDSDSDSVSDSVSVSVSVSASDSVSVSASGSVSGSLSGSVSGSASASASAAPAFPTGWYDADDGSAVHFATPTDYAFVWGRDVEPKTLLAEGFTRDDDTGAWTGRQIALLNCYADAALGAGARELDEQVRLTPAAAANSNAAAGTLRLETHIAAPLPECVARALIAPRLHTVRVLHAIHDAARVRELDALLIEATSPRACERLARCCRSLRGRERMRLGGMCAMPTSSSVECHDRRLEIATSLHRTEGECVDDAPPR